MPLEIAVRSLTPCDVPACERILRSLPEWFGIESSIVEYLQGLTTHRGFVALLDGGVVGFLALREHFPESAEVCVMAVQQEHHRKGVGRALMQGAEASLGGNTALLHVKTLGPSDPDAGYARTRRFYHSMGFVPLEETTAIWGPENPCLLLVKPLSTQH